MPKVAMPVHCPRFGVESLTDNPETIIANVRFLVASMARRAEFKKSKPLACLNGLEGIDGVVVQVYHHTVRIPREGFAGRPLGEAVGTQRPRVRSWSKRTSARQQSSNASLAWEFWSIVGLEPIELVQLL